MAPQGGNWIGALAILTLLGGCAEAENPYNIPPMLAGEVRLHVALADAAGTPGGTQTVTDAGGIRVWLMEDGRAVDSTLTERGVYLFFLARNRTYRVQTGIRPTFADSSGEITSSSDRGYYADLQLWGVGDLGSRPNPFAGQVTLSFNLGADTQLEIEVYDLSARRVRVLAARSFAAGAHELIWDGRDDSASEAPAGMYWVLVESVSETRAELVVKQS